MSLTETDLRLIDKHLQGQLDPKEEKLFLEKQHNPEFKKELDLRKNTLSVLKKNGRLELKAKFQNIEKEIQGKNVAQQETETAKVRKINSSIWISVAATLLFLVGMFWWTTQSLNSDQLFAQHFQPYPNIIAPIVKSQTPSPSQYELAFQKYEQKNYQEAIPLLKEIKTNEGRFYLAIAHLANEEEKQAIALLADLIKEPSNRFYEASQWYLALAYLKTSQSNKATDILDLIKQKREHNFYNKAKDIVN